MSFFSLLALALGLSMDAFAVSISQGAILKKNSIRHALRTGLLFGVIEGVTPLIGWCLGTVASHLIMAWSHWLAFILLLTLGSRMIYAGWHNHITPVVSAEKPSVLVLIATAIATSIDALAIGIGLALLQVNILYSALAIGCVTGIMSTAGILFGRFIGHVAGRWAEILGGLLLITMGCQILFMC